MREGGRGGGGRIFFTEKTYLLWRIMLEKTLHRHMSRKNLYQACEQARRACSQANLSLEMWGWTVLTQTKSPISQPLKSQMVNSLFQQSRLNLYLQNVVVKVARTSLYTPWLSFWIAFLGRNDLTDFYDFFASLKKNGENLRKCYLFSCRTSLGLV